MTLHCLSVYLWHQPVPLPGVHDVFQPGAEEGAGAGARGRSKGQGQEKGQEKGQEEQKVEEEQGLWNVQPQLWHQER